jgi:hypothetical protein
MKADMLLRVRALDAAAKNTAAAPVPFDLDRWSSSFLLALIIYLGVYAALMVTMICAFIKAERARFPRESADSAEKMPF